MSKNKMSFEIDVNNFETDKSLREQVEDQLEENGFTEEDINEESFEQGLDKIYGRRNEEDDEDEDGGVEVNTDEDAEDVSTTTTTTEAKKKEEVAETSDEDATEEKAAEQKKQFGDRANKRIRELNEQKKAAWEEAEAARKEKFEAQKQNLETREELLTFKVEKLKKDFESAINDGDASKQVEINTELAKIGADLSKIEEAKTKYSTYKPTEKTVKEQDVADQDVFGVEYNQEKAVKLADDWEFNNPRVLTDPVYSKTALHIGQKLMERGFKPDSQEFFDELSHRMSLAYGLSSKEKDPASSTTQQTTDSAKKEVATKKAAPQKVQTVAGTSRTPAPTSLSNQTNGNTVRLSKEDIAQAKKLGQNLKTYALNMSRVEKGTRENGSISVELFPDD